MSDIRSLTRSRPVETTLQYEGDTVTLTFDANKVTPRWMHTALEELRKDDGVMAMAEALADVIVGWDVMDGDQPYPASGENIGVLSFSAINRLFERVCEAAGPSDAEGNASPPSADEPLSATSNPGSPTSQNGSVTSPSPTPSASLPVT